jgi:hypothetical protein
MSNKSTIRNRCTLDNYKISSSCTSVRILNDDVLHHLISFLDFPSLKKFRLVCTRWATLALPHLNSRGYFRIAPGYLNNNNADDDTTYSYYNLDLEAASSEYSSLKFELTYLLAAYPMQINQPDVWKHVKSLHITVPLTRERILWICKLISSLCSPNLSDLTINFSRDDDEHSSSKQVDWDYNLALNNRPNVSFPTLPEYPHLESLTFEGIYTPSTSYFACHLISSSSNLQHLSFKRCTHSGCLQYGSFSFPLFQHLMRVNKNSLRNLESFKLTMQNEEQIDESDLISVDTDTLQEPIYSDNHIQLIRTLRHIQDFQLSFGKNLKSLVWHVPFAARENKLDSFQLLPGILSKSVASSLVKLQLNSAVYLLNRKRSFDGPTVIPISFPCFHNLRELSVGNHTASTLSLSDFVNSAPNLCKLVISGPGLQTEEILQKSGRIRMLRMCWRLTINNSNLNQQQHNQLRVFETDMSIGEKSTLSKIFKKFPNLEQVKVGEVSGTCMKHFLKFIRASKLTKLKRLNYAYENKTLTMRELFAHIAKVPKLLPNLDYYFLKRDNGFVREPEAKLKELLTSTLLLKRISSSGGGGVPNIILNIRKFVCLHKDKDSEICPQNCQQFKIHRFIRKHQLPIQIRAIEEYEGPCFLPIEY